MTHPLYEEVRPVLAGARVLLQANPGPLTLDGTNTWLINAPDSDSVIVVDPGQQDAVHLEKLLNAAPRIAVVLVTHGHPDHSGTVAEVHARTGAPVRATDPQFCLGAEPLVDDLELPVAGLRVRVLATPGHSSDSTSFFVSTEEGEPAAVLTGDTILGRGTTVVVHPDGHLGDYLDSLHRLGALGGVPVLPGHGPELPSAADAAAFYLAHRQERLDQIRAALRELGPDATPRQLVQHVYADVDEAVWGAAELSVNAQLTYLREQGD